LRSNSTARFCCGIPRTSAENSSNKIEMSGLGRPAAARRAYARPTIGAAQAISGIHKSSHNSSDSLSDQSSIPQG
jgi:hypothetical protein